MTLATAAICNRYARGYSCARIAQQDGRCEGTIFNILRSEGVTLRTKSEANKKCSDEAVRVLHNMGLSHSQVGELLGVHSTTILKRLQVIGYPPRVREVAAGVRYSDEEFERFFLNDQFLDTLSEVAA